MIRLNSTHYVQAFTDAITANQCQFVTSYDDINTSAVSLTPGENDGNMTDVTPVIIVASPTSGLFRNIKYLSIYNADTTARLVTVEVYNGATNRIMIAVTLQATEALIYNDGAGWIVMASSGQKGLGVSGFSGFSGYSGKSGFSGYSGVSGFSGTNGTNGTNGTSGFSGYSGVSGYSGYSGVSGYSGFSGYSGVSGYSGNGSNAARSGATSGISNSEFQVISDTIAANTRLQVGTVIRATLWGTCTSTVGNTQFLQLRVGTAGGSGDPAVTAVTWTSAASGTNIPFKIILETTIQTLGSSATGVGVVVVENSGTTGLNTVATNVFIDTSGTTFNSTTATNVHVGYVSNATTTTCTFQGAYIEFINK